MLIVYAIDDYFLNQIQKKVKKIGYKIDDFLSLELADYFLIDKKTYTEGNMTMWIKGKFLKYKKYVTDLEENQKYLFYGINVILASNLEPVLNKKMCRFDNKIRFRIDNKRDFVFDTKKTAMFITPKLLTIKQVSLRERFNLVKNFRECPCKQIQSFFPLNKEDERGIKLITGFSKIKFYEWTILENQTGYVKIKDGKILAVRDSLPGLYNIFCTVISLLI